MEKWLVQSLDVLTVDLNLTWLVLKTYLTADPRPSVESLRRTVVPLFLAIINDDEVCERERERDWWPWRERSHTLNGLLRAGLSEVDRFCLRWPT
jgi:hypothetical protein